MIAYYNKKLQPKKGRAGRGGVSKTKFPLGHYNTTFKFKTLCIQETFELLIWENISRTHQLELNSFNIPKACLAKCKPKPYGEPLQCFANLHDQTTLWTFSSCHITWLKTRLVISYQTIQGMELCGYNHTPSFFSPINPNFPQGFSIHLMIP